MTFIGKTQSRRSKEHWGMMSGRPPKHSPEDPANITRNPGDPPGTLV